MGEQIQLALTNVYKIVKGDHSKTAQLEKGDNSKHKKELKTIPNNTLRLETIPNNSVL